VVGITVLVALATWLPLPAPVQMRDWAESMGPWFPLAFFVAHVVVTVVPVPRTAFTLAAGLLFGPLTGVLIAVLASTASAMIAMLLVRAAGWRLDRLVRHRSIDTVNDRLLQRGWLAILSLRLIPAVPFSAINYAAGSEPQSVFAADLDGDGAGVRGGGDPLHSALDLHAGLGVDSPGIRGAGRRVK